MDADSWFSVGMKNFQNTQDIKPSTQASNESKTEQKNNNQTTADSVSLSASSNDGQKVSRQDIELVQNLIERCLQLYMNKDEVVKTLLTRARIDPGFTTLVWQKLEEENADFFRAYYIRLKLKKQILLFNHLLEHQYHLMKYPMHPKVPLIPMQNGIHSMPVNNLPTGYPVMQQPLIPAAGQPHLDSMEISSCHLVNGVSMRMNNGTDVTHAVPPTTVMSSMSEMPVSPSVTSSGNFPFTATDMSGMGIDTSAPDNGADNSRDSLRSFDQIQWDFSFTDLKADFSNLGDLGSLGNHHGSFLPSDSEILLDSPEHETIEEFFVDHVPGQPCTPSDEEKS